MPNIVVVGSLNMDIVLNVDELPKEGQTLIGASMLEVSGGKRANQAVAIGKMQTSVYYDRKSWFRSVCSTFIRFFKKERGRNSTYFNIKE